jgi:ubiquinone/menaquinone biosynthesis C-methylase UbiE
MSYWDPDNFNSLYYTGPLGFIAKSQHYLLEAKYTKRDFFACTLELAATNGYHFKFITHGFNEYLMLDIRRNEQIIKVASENYNVKFVEDDATYLNTISSNSIDRLLTTCLLHHLADPSLALENWIRVLKQGGVLDILMPCEPTTLWKIGRLFFVAIKFQNISQVRAYYAQIKTEHVQTYKNLLHLLQINRHIKIISSHNWPFRHLPWYLNIWSVIRISKI